MFVRSLILNTTNGKYEQLIESMPDAFASHRIVTNEQGLPVDYVFLEVNFAFEEMTGLKKDHIIGKTVTEAIPGIEKSNFDWIGTYGKVALERENISLVQYSEPLNCWYEVFAFSSAHGYFETLFRDISDLRKTESKLLESEKRSSAVLSTLPDLIFIFNREGVCLDYHAGDPTSLIAAPESFLNKPIFEYLPASLAKRVKEYLALAHETGQLQTFEYSLNMDDGLKHFEARINNIDGERNVVIVRDITCRKEAEESQKQSIAVYRNALEGMIESMGCFLEKRDPYTARHQLNVARLAVDIAEEMGLDYKRIEGLKLAAKVHDLGKIEIPAEILNRPGQLSDTEFELIKQHPQAGYDILGKIEFPWPIATIVQQHHEKIDGSGYPNGLAGDEILLEAKILTVADVIEAMASHRPYRPALGIEIALSEILHHKGKHFEPEVVEACLNLFNKKGYKLNGIDEY